MKNRLAAHGNVHWVYFKKKKRAENYALNVEMLCLVAESNCFVMSNLLIRVWFSQCGLC